jgi:putative transposase
MQLVEQHCIDRSDPRYALIDETAFQSKNLYNAALYMVRQTFMNEGKYLNYHAMDKLMQQYEAYQALPRKVSQWVLKGLHQNWRSFFESLNAYREDPSKFNGRPKLPHYKHKTKGRNLLVYTLQAISKKELVRGIVKPSQLAITVKTK